MERSDFLSAVEDELMETPKLKYVGGYKYQIRNDILYKSRIYPVKDIVTELVILRKDGWLLVKKYFAFDGCSGPTLDDKTNMRSCLIHDAFYYLMREGFLPASYRHIADSMLREVMEEDGAWEFRARYYERAVNWFARKYATCKARRKIHTSP
jgi:hypothetical protein